MYANQFDILDFDLNYVVYSLPSYVYWKDLNSVYQGCNKLLAEISNLADPSEIVGKTDYDFDWGKADAAEFIKTDQWVINNNQMHFSEQVMPFEGGQRTFKTIKQPLVGKSGKIIGILGTAIDITAEKEAEQLRLQARVQQKIMEEQGKFRSFIGKMVHDIRSPLVSLKNLVQSATELPEKKRRTLRSAAITITDIAGHMLRKYSNKADIGGNQRQQVLLPEAIEHVLSEKRFEYNLNVQFELYLKNNSDFAFIKIEPIKFKRMLSNLINNAIEATHSVSNAKITITLSGHHPDNYILSIIDNGIGMSKATIDKIMEGSSITENKINGHGIGMSQVREALTDNLGSLKIDSKINHGTTVTMSFPRSPAPSWFTSTVKVTEDSIIVILDDDPSIHETWDLRLQDIIAALTNVKVLHFSKGSKALEYIDKLSQQDRQRVCLLADYELLNEKIHGLSVIRQSGIKRATLITSYYDNIEFQYQALELGIKILPKDLVPKAIIRFDDKLIPYSKKVDAVWIEDAFLELKDIIEVEYKHLKIDMYEDPVIFLEELEQYPLDTKIIFDYYFYFDYDERVKTMNGLTLAELLHNKGYTNLHLCTAEDIAEEKIPPYLKYVYKMDVLDKESLSLGMFNLRDTENKNATMSL